MVQVPRVLVRGYVLRDLGSASSGPGQKLPLLRQEGAGPGGLSCMSAGGSPRLPGIGAGRGSRWALGVPKVEPVVAESAWAFSTHGWKSSVSS